MRITFVLLIGLLCACAAAPSVGSMVTPAPEEQESLDKGLSDDSSGGASRRSAKLEDAAGMPLAQEPAAPAAPTRQVIYSGRLRLVVVSAAEASRSVQKLAEEAGGYLQESNATSITIRVPAPKFEATLARIAELGEVQERAVKAADITEEMLDLNIRLENARKTRARLLEHLEKSTKIEDTLKIEAELSRVSGDIEQMEGKLRFFQSQIAMSTIRVELNTAAPQDRGRGGIGVPFAWLDQLGDGLVAGNVESMPRRPQFFSRGPKFDPPTGFIRYYSSDDLVEALDAGGLRIKVQKHENYDKGALVFWQSLARKSLVQNRALAIGVERDLGSDRALISGSRLVAGEQAGYLLVLGRTKERVWTFEAWGPKAAFDAQFDALVASAKTLER